jgi:DNA polymerase I
MIALIDGDIVAYRCAASAENDEVEIAIARCDELIRRILHDTGSTELVVYLSGGENFRKKIDPEYKANRKDEKPKWLESLREHLVINWKAQVSDGVEADDLIAIDATNAWNDDVPFVICSLDKDFRQLPGKHYSWDIQGTVKGKQWSKPAELVFVSPLEARKNFYKQLLIGDSADNITGVTNIGKVKASKVIDPLDLEQDMFDTVLSLYNYDTERLLKNGKLLWLLRTNDLTTWEFPFPLKLEQDTEAKS